MAPNHPEFEEYAAAAPELERAAAPPNQWTCEECDAEFPAPIGDGYWDACPACHSTNIFRCHDGPACSCAGCVEVRAILAGQVSP
jgi:hypothetical protein